MEVAVQGRASLCNQTREGLLRSINASKVRVYDGGGMTPDKNRTNVVEN